MNEHRIRVLLEGGGGWPGRLLRAGLWIPGKLYGAVMETRRLMYLADMLSSHPLPLPAVSVGNLTAGGSGKTPFVLRLAKHFISIGIRPGILLRGYRGTPGQGSDEALLYQTACPGAVVEVGGDRVASAGRAAARGADVLILDDAFQHLRAKRDADIVLVDALSPWGGGNTIPGGLLREPKSALAKANAVIVTRSDQVPIPRLNILKAEIAGLVAPGVSVYTACHQPAALADLAGTALPVGDLAGRRVVALAGIARPEAFVATLAGLGAEVVAERFGRDHGVFSSGFMAEALATAGRLGAVVVTTEKDRARLVLQEQAMQMADNTNIWVLGVVMRVDGEARLHSWLLSVLGLAVSATPA